MRSSMPLTPLGMALKSWMPALFWVEFQGQWSVATMSSTPPATAAFSPSWCSAFLMGGLITYFAASCSQSQRLNGDEWIQVRHLTSQLKRDFNIIVVDDFDIHLPAASIGCELRDGDANLKVGVPNLALLGCNARGNRLSYHPLASQLCVCNKAGSALAHDVHDVDGRVDVLSQVQCPCCALILQKTQYGGELCVHGPDTGRLFETAQSCRDLLDR